MTPDLTQQLADKLAIQEATSNYFFAVDAADVDAYLAVWAEDGVSESSGLGNATGHEELRARFMKASQDFSKGKRHVVSNFAIEMQGDTATQRVYLLVVEREKKPAVEATAVYEDTLRRIDGTWKFTRRRQTIDPGYQAEQ